jgi:hypothetical protein
VRVEQGLDLGSPVGRRHDDDEGDGAGRGHGPYRVDEHGGAVQRPQCFGGARTEAYTPTGGRDHGCRTGSRAGPGGRGTRIVRHRFLSGLCARPTWVWPQRAGRDILTGPFRDIWSSQLPGPGTPSIGDPTPSYGIRFRGRVRTCRSARRQYVRHRAPRHLLCCAERLSGLAACLSQFRTRGPRPAGPRPCPRWCSPRGRARSPGSAGPWRACASHRRTVRAHAHDATGHGLLPRP